MRPSRRLRYPNLVNVPDQPEQGISKDRAFVRREATLGFRKVYGQPKVFRIVHRLGLPDGVLDFLDEGFAKLARLHLPLMRPLADLDANAPPGSIGVDHIWWVVLRIPFVAGKPLTSFERLKQFLFFAFLLRCAARRSPAWADFVHEATVQLTGMIDNKENPACDGGE